MKKLHKTTNYIKLHKTTKNYIKCPTISEYALKPYPRIQKSIILYEERRQYVLNVQYVLNIQYVINQITQISN